MKRINILLFAALIFLSLGCLVDDTPTDDGDNPTTNDEPKNDEPDSRLLTTNVVRFEVNIERDGDVKSWTKNDVRIEVGCNQFIKGHEFKVLMPNSSVIQWLVRTNESGMWSFGGDMDQTSRQQVNPTTSQFTPIETSDGYYTRLVEGDIAIDAVPTVLDDENKHTFRGQFLGMFLDVNTDKAAKVALDWEVQYSKSPTHCQ